MATVSDKTPRLLVLGSAAAEGIPALFCDCRICRAAAEHGGPDVRARTSYNFGGTIQIDFGPDILQAWQTYREALSRMRHILVTHAHEDHLHPEDLLYRGPGFASVPIPEGIVTIHGTGKTYEKIRDGFWLRPEETFDGKLARSRLAFHEFKQFDAFALPDVGAFVRTFKADHDIRLDPCILTVTMGGRTVLIGHDTGLFPNETWKALEALRGELSIDIAVLDDTGMLKGVPGAPEGDAWVSNHMSAPSILETLDKLDALGLLAPDCIRAVNHFSHNGGSTHDEMRAFYEPRGIVVCHDGMEL